MKVQHKTTCPGPDEFDSIGARGDAVTRCRACGRFALARSSTQTRRGRTQFDEVIDMPRPPWQPLASKPASPKPAAAPALPDRYRCAVHIDRRVTWRGTGCPDCEHERAARQRDREEAAWARRERAERDRQG